MEKQKIKSYVIKMIDFACAISIDEKSVKPAGLALTMSEAIQDYGVKLLELLDCD